MAQITDKITGKTAAAKTTRRKFLAGSALASGAVIASPALAQGNPEVKWRMPLFVPRSFDVLWGECVEFTKRVAEATEGKFQIQPFSAGEIVPGGPAVLDAVEAGTVECGYTLSYYSVGKDPTYAFGSTLPFGFNTRLQQAWYLRGGGGELCEEFFNSKNVTAIVMGNSTTQMGGWFRKEINTVDDLKGLKMRIPGLAGRVIAKLGVIPQQIPPGEIYPALERGTIDAAEWAAPHDDERLGFVKVAPYYYSPGWWEPNAMTHLFVHLPAWNGLPAHYKAIVRSAAEAINQTTVARYDVVNPLALRRLAANGAKLRFFSPEIMNASYEASFALYDEIGKSNARFAKIYTHWKKFLDESELYLRVADNYYENFIWSRRSKG
jgi:TRAP-type mannitol/chloroaromatic compound transport system substrate-binding protein